MPVQIYRVVVRGQFADLDEGVRADLAARADDHDIFRSAYTAAGTFTYEPRLEAFSFRFEVREHVDDDGAPADVEASVAARAEALATAYLDERGITWKRLRSNVVNMADMWRTASS